MNEWIIYWILKLDMLVELCISISILSFVIVITCISTTIYWKTRKPLYSGEKTSTGDPSEYFIRMKNNFLVMAKKGLTISVALFLISFFPAVFLPTTKQACVILILPKIINNEHIRNVPNDFSKLVNEKLTEWIDEIKDMKQKHILQP